MENREEILKTIRDLSQKRLLDRYRIAKENGTLDKFRAKLIVSGVRKKYSIDDEFSIHRNRYKKPEKFAEYNDYVESVISSVDSLIKEWEEQA